MLTFKQHIATNAKGYLYHGTTLENTYRIIRSNQLAAYQGSWSNRVQEPAVFFSREHMKAAWFTQWFRNEKHPIVLVFDREKLAQNYKITPIQNNARRTATSHEGHKSHTGLRGVLAEEYIAGSVDNVDKYLVRIDVFYNDTWEMINKEKSKFPKLKNSEKLLHFTPEWVK